MKHHSKNIGFYVCIVFFFLGIQNIHAESYSRKYNTIAHAFIDIEKKEGFDVLAKDSLSKNAYEIIDLIIGQSQKPIDNYNKKCENLNGSRVTPREI